MGLLEEKLVESKSGDGNNGMLQSEDEENDLNPRIQEGHGTTTPKTLRQNSKGGFPSSSLSVRNDSNRLSDTHRVNQMLVETIEDEQLAKLRSVDGNAKGQKQSCSASTDSPRRHVSVAIQPTEMPERHTNIQLEPGAVRIQPWGWDSEDDDDTSNNAFSHHSDDGRDIPGNSCLDLEQAAISMPNQELVVQGELGQEEDERIRQDVLDNMVPVPAQIWEADNQKAARYRRWMAVLLIALGLVAIGTTIGVSKGNQKNNDNAYSIPAPSMVPSVSMYPSLRPSLFPSRLPSLAPSEAPTHFVWSQLLGINGRELVERSRDNPTIDGLRFASEVVVAGPLDSNSTMMVAASYFQDNTVEFFSCDLIWGCQPGLVIQQGRLLTRQTILGTPALLEGYIRIALSSDGKRLAILTILSEKDEPVYQIWLFDFSVMQIDALEPGILTNPNPEPTSYQYIWEASINSTINSPRRLEFSEDGNFLVVMADILYIYQISVSNSANSTGDIQHNQTFQWDPVQSADSLPVQPGREVLLCTDINNDVIAIGSNIKFEDSNPNNVGWDVPQPPYYQGFRVRTFATNGDQIGQTLEYPPPFSLQAPRLQSCNSLALSANGTLLAIGFFNVLPGVQLNNQYTFDEGQVDFYELIDEEWHFLNESSLVSENESSRGFGVSVEMSEDGSVLAVGDPYVSDSRGSAIFGSLQMYRRGRNNVTWDSWGSPFAGQYPDGAYASTVSISQSGDFVVAGSPNAKDLQGGFYTYQTASTN